MKKATRRALEDKLFNFIGAPLGVALLRLLRWTRRVGWQNGETFFAARRGDRPFICIFWHEDLIGSALQQLAIPRGPVCVMVSRSRDGEKLARIVAGIGLTPIRASSSRGAVAGVIEVLRFLRTRGRNPAARAPLAALALDGPKGPRHVVKPGVSLMARKAGALVIPLAYRNTLETVVKSWDRTRIPLPFGRTTILVGEAIDAAQWTGDDVEFTALLQARLEALDAERRVQK